MAPNVSPEVPPVGDAGTNTDDVDTGDIPVVDTEMPKEEAPPADGDDGKIVDTEAQLGKDSKFEVEEEDTRTNPFVVTVAIAAALGGLIFGYDIGGAGKLML